jgi:hypothetical protein
MSGKRRVVGRAAGLQVDGYVQSVMCLSFEKDISKKINRSNKYVSRPSLALIEKNYTTFSFTTKFVFPFIPTLTLANVGQAGLHYGVLCWRRRR